MSHYPAYICENGHEISSSSDICAEKFCSQCGAPIISKCPTCNSIIRGKPRSEYNYIFGFHVPAYCCTCGNPFPWTNAAIEAVKYMLEESDLSFDEQKKIVDILPDAMTETPRTQLAAIRFRKFIASAGEFVADGLRQFAIDFGCEIFKSYLGLH
ncbi:MAG: DUF2321 domain-containing protein [Faecousia sp.]